MRVVYFLLVGWWFGALAGFLGYLLCASILFLPFGVMLLNRIPALVFLKPRHVAFEVAPGVWGIHEELPFLVRAIWFFVLGWELGLLVFVVGYLFILTIIGIPIGLFLLNAVPMVLTLSQRYRVA